MKLIWKYCVVILLISCIGFISFNYIYPLWGRRVTYKFASQITEYPGIGTITTLADEKVLILPIEEGKPFYTSKEEASKYSTKTYNIIDIPKQEQVLYTVGAFAGWEDVPDSADKYLLLKNPQTKLMEKYRLDFSFSGLFKDQYTLLMIEVISLGNKKTKNKIYYPDQNILANIGYTKIKSLFDIGDTVIITPVIDPPSLNRQDENGHYLASKLVIRRISSKTNLNFK